MGKTLTLTCTKSISEDKMYNIIHTFLFADKKFTAATKMNFYACKILKYIHHHPDWLISQS